MAKWTVPGVPNVTIRADTPDTPPLWYDLSSSRAQALERGDIQMGDPWPIPDTLTRAEAEAMVEAALREAAGEADAWFCPGYHIGRLEDPAPPTQLGANILALIPSAGSALDRVVAEARREERERCAQIFDRNRGPWLGGNAAAAIRAQGDV